MPDTDRTMPTRCTRCGEALKLPLACIPCQALNLDAPEDMDYFRLFGIEPGFDVAMDELHQRFVAMSRLAHPDLASDPSEETRRKSLSLSATINRAYDTLKSPVRRAEYLLGLAGGTSSAEDKSVPGQLLGEVMMLREEIEEARGANDHAALKAMAVQVSQRRTATLAQVEQLSRTLPSAGPEVRKQLREQLNAMKYWDNLLEQLPEA